MKLLNVEATHLSEHLPGNAPDEQVVEKARELAAIVVAQDLDFTTRKQLFLDMAAKGVSVVVLRPPKGAQMDQLAELILYYRQTFYDVRDHEGPIVISVKRPALRARRLSSIDFQRIKG